MNPRQRRGLTATVTVVALVSSLVTALAPVALAKPGGLPAAKPPPTQPSTFPPLSACPIFPATNVWNKPVDTLGVAGNSATMIAAIGNGIGLHPDFSAARSYGIPYNIVGTSTPRVNPTFLYDDESDHVGYPIPSGYLQERSSDHHILMIDTNACRLYELFDAAKKGSRWSAGSGASWSLLSNDLRPETWTSADAAGLPIFPGLIRRDEVVDGVIDHALRFTAPVSCEGYLYPARHEAGSTTCDVAPPMGLRVRLKSTVNISGFAPDVRVVLTALKKYGAILADNGSAWFLTGAPDPTWNDDVMHTLNQIHGSDFEVVDTTGLVNG